MGSWIFFIIISDQLSEIEEDADDDDDDDAEVINRSRRDLSGKLPLVRHSLITVSEAVAIRKKMSIIFHT